MTYNVFGGTLNPTLLLLTQLKNLQSTAVKRGDLLRLSYTKTVFGPGSTRDPTRRSHDAPPHPLHVLLLLN